MKSVLTQRDSVMPNKLHVYVYNQLLRSKYTINKKDCNMSNVLKDAEDIKCCNQ